MKLTRINYGVDFSGRLLNCTAVGLAWSFHNESEGQEMTFKKFVIAVLLAGATALPMSSANAFWGGNSWMPWNWFDDDYYGGGPWVYPGYGWGGYPGYGYPGYGWGGYPGYGYGGYPGYAWGGYQGYGYGGYPGYGWGGYPGARGW